MKDKIEIGEYIRTIDGYIRKIDNINTGRKITIYGEHILDIPYKNSQSVAKNKIVKHSKNIIDLIKKRRLCKWKRSYYGFTKK